MKEPRPGGVWWMLELERRPGEWIPTGHVIRRVKRPKPLPYNKSGRPTRWVESPVQSELAVH